MTPARQAAAFAVLAAAPERVPTARLAFDAHDLFVALAARWGWTIDGAAVRRVGLGCVFDSPGVTRPRLEPYPGAALALTLPIGHDGEVWDIVVQEWRAGGAFRRIENVAQALGWEWAERGAERLRVHRTPLGWLAARGLGWCPIVPLAEIDPILLEDVGALIAEDAGHAAELERWIKARRPRRPRLRYLNGGAA